MWLKCPVKYVSVVGEVCGQSMWVSVGECGCSGRLKYVGAVGEVCG